MTDPYCTLDGFSYEKTAIEAWLKKSSLSPLTGQPLPNLTLIPNRNLKSAIANFTLRNPSEKSGTLNPSHRHRIDSDRGFSLTMRGTCAVITDHRNLVRVSTPSTWTDVAAFIEAPLKGYGLSSSVTIEVIQISIEWGGMVMGVSPIDFRNAPDRLRLLEETSFRLDGQGWFHHPDHGASLQGWNSQDLRKNDIVSMEFPSDGGFIVKVNEEIRVEIRDAKIPDGPLFGFISVMGSCEEIRLISP